MNTRSITQRAFGVLAIAGALFAGTQTAHASWFPGTLCNIEVSPENALYQGSGLYNFTATGNGTLPVYCGVPEDVNVGTTVQTQVVVADTDPSTAVDCNVDVYDLAGKLLWESAPVSTTKAFTGIQTLRTANGPTNVGVNTGSLRKVTCDLPDMAAVLAFTVY